MTEPQERGLPASMSGPLSGRRLATFTGRGYVRGGSAIKRALWVGLGQPVQACILCPVRLRVAILRAFGAKIGPGVLIRHHVQVHWPWKLTVGRDSWIGVDVWLLNLEPIVIGSDVCISQQALLCTGSHRASDPAFEFDNAPIEICTGAWVAARATVLRGVTVGANAIVGAGVILATDLPAGARALPPRPQIHSRWGGRATLT